METSLVLYFVPVLSLRVTVFIYNFFARDLGSAAALHGLDGFFVTCHLCTDWQCA